MEISRTGSAESTNEDLDGNLHRGTGCVCFTSVTARDTVCRILASCFGTITPQGRPALRTRNRSRNTDTTANRHREIELVDRDCFGKKGRKATIVWGWGPSSPLLQNDQESNPTNPRSQIAGTRYSTVVFFILISPYTLCTCHQTVERNALSLIRIPRSNCPNTHTPPVLPLPLTDIQIEENRVELSLLVSPEKKRQSV